MHSRECNGNERLRKNVQERIPLNKAVKTERQNSHQYCDCALVLLTLISTLRSHTGLYICKAISFFSKINTFSSTWV